MGIKCVVDSSTLISLSKIRGLKLFEDLGFSVFCPHGVYNETVNMALLHGYYDALEIKKLIDGGMIIVKKARHILISGIEKTDADVISLGKELNAVILANDTKLARIARGKNIEVFGSPDLLFLAKERKIIPHEEYIVKINELVEKKRLSAKTAEEYLR